MNYFVLEGDPLTHRLKLSTVVEVLRENNIAQGVQHDRGWKILGIFKDSAAAESFRSIIELHKPS